MANRLPDSGMASSSAAVRANSKAVEAWVNEGGSLAPRGDEDALAGARALAANAGREARDTVAGCRDRANQDRLNAAKADTVNSRRVFEGSAASWDARAVQIDEADRASTGQRLADRALWDEEDGVSPA